MTLNTHEISFLFISFQSLMFALILLTGKGPKKQSNFLLAALLIVLGTQMAVLLGEGSWFATDKIQPYLCLFGFAYGPLLYLYTQSLIYKKFSLDKKKWTHAIPFFIMLISALIGYALCSRFGSLLYISLIAYSAVAIRDIVRYRVVVKQTQSSIFQMNLSWLQWMLIAFTCTFLIDIYQHFYAEINIIPGLSLVNVSLLILINGMFYKGLKQPMIFQGISLADETLVSPISMTKEEADIPDEELIRIKNYMASLEPFKDAALTLNELASQLEMPARKLSGLINRHFGQNFIDFVNTYRIELAKSRLKNPVDPKETILEVMYEVGFNSKSSFNTLFKQKTGSTPSDFKKQSI